jgi:alpha/beta superfamily hydrolase
MACACPSDAVVVEAVRFRRGEWVLSGELAYDDGRVPSVAAVVAGPHPLLGGTMANNVVRGLGDGLARRGVVTLRFDYRGTGASEGPAAVGGARLAEFWQTSRLDDEAEYRGDVAAAVAFLRSSVGPAVRLTLVGYSFGCALLADLPCVDAATPRALVAPTVGTHDYDSFATVTAPKLVIAPRGDFAADDGRLREWFDRLPPPKELIRPAADGHFFRGHEDWLAETVGRFIADKTEANA